MSQARGADKKPIQKRNCKLRVDADRPLLIRSQCPGRTARGTCMFVTNIGS